MEKNMKYGLALSIFFVTVTILSAKWNSVLIPGYVACLLTYHWWNTYMPDK